MNKKENSICPFVRVREHAKGIADGKITVGELTALFDELNGYRRYFEEWIGEHSPEYQMANAMLVLSRVLKSTSENSSIKHWVTKYPLYQEWYKRILLNVDKHEKWEFVSDKEVSQLA